MCVNDDGLSYGADFGFGELLLYAGLSPDAESCSTLCLCSTHPPNDLVTLLVIKPRRSLSP